MLKPISINILTSGNSPKGNIENLGKNLFGNNGSNFYGDESNDDMKLVSFDNDN
jgi:hypothetical protein